jgi:hypothetical protein
LHDEELEGTTEVTEELDRFTEDKSLSIVNQEDMLIGDFDLEAGLDKEIKEVEQLGRAAQTHIMEMLHSMEKRGETLLRESVG